MGKCVLQTCPGSHVRKYVPSVQPRANILIFSVKMKVVMQKWLFPRIMSRAALVLQQAKTTANHSVYTISEANMVILAHWLAHFSVNLQVQRATDDWTTATSDSEPTLHPALDLETSEKTKWASKNKRSIVAEQFTKVGQIDRNNIPQLRKTLTCETSNQVRSTFFRCIQIKRLWYLNFQQNYQLFKDTLISNFNNL